jgi:dTDP-4-amino-4,6-dideoxy-D-glucose acyltransferase
MGKSKIILEDFSGISTRISIYSNNDDNTGDFMTNPTVPKEYTGVTHANIKICKHALIGCGSIILPSVTINQRVVIGTLNLVTMDSEEFYI